MRLLRLSRDSHSKYKEHVGNARISNEAFAMCAGQRCVPGKKACASERRPWQRVASEGLEPLLTQAFAF